MTTNLLDFTDVSYARANKTILKNINWHVQPGQNWAILGLNGSGKTTLLKMIHGDIWPSSGTVSVLGHRFGETNIPDLQKQIGWVSNALQDRIHPGDSAESIVLGGRYGQITLYRKCDPSEFQEAKLLLTQIGGKNVIGKPYRVLSQGEKQLVLIARALITSPKLLILDEPCNGLDLFARQRLLRQIQKISELEDGPALLIVSHYTEELLPCFDHLLLLKAGEIFDQGLRKDLMTPEVLAPFYGAPVEIQHDTHGNLIVYPK
ncbi:ABC transporter ATP-binding protein [Leuconostocaceae bacterium ESL0723]|nr:ABC transporter ATP-binding protein [Leuconostocaceae bacterium ESL0723]